MQAYTLEALQSRSDLELSVLFRLCADLIAQSQPYSTAWLAATHTAGNIIRERSRREREKRLCA